jgi:hypothetical protein
MCSWEAYSRGVAISKRGSPKMDNQTSVLDSTRMYVACIQLLFLSFPNQVFYYALIYPFLLGESKSKSRLGWVVAIFALDGLPVV